MRKTQMQRQIAVLTCVLINAAFCGGIGAAGSSGAAGVAAPVDVITSERVVLNDVIYRLEWKENSLYLDIQSLTSGTHNVRHVATKFSVADGQQISQIAVSKYREKGLIVALKITSKGEVSEFVELTFWRGKEAELNGRFREFKFLRTNAAYEILALTSNTARGVFVIVGKQSMAADADISETEGFLFDDGCPWLCMGGRLSQFNAKSLPLDQELPFDATKPKPDAAPGNR